MGIMGEMDERFVNMEKKIGVFLVAAACGIALLLVFIGIKQNFFTSKATVYFIADSGYDLGEGLPVKLSGFVIGKVKRLTMDDVARVKTELSINKRYMKWIKADSKARLMKTGLVGEGFIDITPGTASARPLESEGFIRFERERSINEMVGEVTDEMVQVLADLNRAVHYVNDPQGDLRTGLRNFNKLSVGLLATRDKVDSLVADSRAAVASADKTIARLDGVVSDTDAAVLGAGHAIEEVDRLVSGSTAEVKSAIGNLDGSLADIRAAAGDIRKASREMPSLVGKGSKAADETAEVMGAAKKVWPIRLYVDTPSERRIKIDSCE